jgi:hypothetical protein
LGASAALFAGLVGPSVGAGATGPGDAGAPIVVSGQLTDGQGAPVSGTIALLLQPPPGAAGTTTQVPIAASQPVGDDGRYALALDPSSPAVAQALSAGNGWITFTLVARALGLEADTMVSRAYGPSVAAHLGALAASRQATAGWVTRDGGTRPVTLRLHRSSGATPPGQARPLTDYCSEYVWATSSTPTVVGELHKWKDATASFTYGQTADSDIGAQSRDSGSNWTVESAVHISNSRSASVSWSGGDVNNMFGRQLTTNFQYEDQLWGGTACSFEYVRSVGWNGGATWGGDVSTWDNHCDTSPYGDVYKSGSRFDRSSSRAHNYRVGATVWGLGLTAQSGYSTFVKEHWSFGSAQLNHWMCGDNAHETTSAIVYAGPNSG